MEGAENNSHVSKKRSAGVQLSRDNPGLDDEEETMEQESGTFKRASDDILATRRIVKVRRQQTSSTSGSPLAASALNPFATIRLVPTASSVTQEVAADETGKGGSTEVKDSSQVEELKVESAVGTEIVEFNEDNAKHSEVTEDNLEPGQNSLKCEADYVNKLEDSNSPDGISGHEESVDGGKISTEVDNSKNQAEKNIDDEMGKTASIAEKGEEKTTFSSFGQLSSSQNAFSGVSGTGFSSSTFSFRPISNDKPSGIFSFGASNNGNSSLFGTGLNVPSMSQNSKVAPLQEVQVETGEENEMSFFTADSILFEFIDGSWKERGKGELRLNVSTSGTGKARLVMRSKGNFRLILNASLFPDLKLTSMDKKGISFACVNTAAELKDGLSTYALKFKDASIVDNFRAAVVEHKSKTTTATAAMKTPENSPKSPDE